MIRVDALLLLLILYFNVLSSTTVISSSRTGDFEDSSVAHSESLTSSGILSTVAGSHGYSTIPTVYGIAATAAILDSLTEGLARDIAGNLFITTFGNRILTVTASTGLITVVGGTGKKGFSGDGGLATAATFDGLPGIAVDKLGDIYVADRWNHRIRKVTVSTGVITTVAGNGTGYGKGYFYNPVDNVVATSSMLAYPADVAVDTYGNIYIADSGNSRVRKVTASTGIITTVAGNGKVYGELAFPALGVAATIFSFISPHGLSVDTLGNVFFSDKNFNSIYKITASTGLLTLVAGTNNWHYGSNGDNIPATKALLDSPKYVAVDTLGNIFFSDSESSRIRKMTASTGIITTIAGKWQGDCSRNKDGTEATSALLCSPEGTAVDMAGSVYFCDSRSVKKVTFTEVTPGVAVTTAPSMTLVPSSTTANCRNSDIRTHHNPHSNRIIRNLKNGGWIKRKVSI